MELFTVTAKNHPNFKLEFFCSKAQLILILPKLSRAYRDIRVINSFTGELEFRHYAMKEGFEIPPTDKVIKEIRRILVREDF